VIIRPPWFYGPNQPPRQTEFFRMRQDVKFLVIKPETLGRQGEIGTGIRTAHRAGRGNATEPPLGGRERRRVVSKE